MSYILEALKKAQAERQLGDVPTIHAPAIAVAPAGGAGLRNKPLLLALAALGLATAGLLALVLRPAAPTVPGAAPAPQRADAGAVARAMPAPSSAPQAAAVAPPAPRLPAAITPPLAPAAPPVAVARAPAPVAAPRHAAPAPVAAVASAPPAPEEAIQNQRDLPEPIQRAIPPIAMGGYIYSRDPADRLLLIDKVLRHEGEEVAPGLVLDKLLPKAAVFTFKGYRYRVPY